MKYPNLLYTALLLGFLLVPFAIREFAPALEPYPAVLLPSGAGRIKTTQGQIDLGRTGLYGKVAGSNAWTRLSPAEFLNPIPPQDFLPIAQRYFGLSPIGPLALTIKGGLVLRIGTHQVTEDDIKNAKQWLRAKLKGCGCNDEVLRITQEIVTQRLSDGAELAVRYQDDKIFELH